MIKTIFLIVIASLLIGCVNQMETKDNKTSFERINIEESKQLIDSGITILDIRTPQEYNQEKIEGSINIDYYAKDFKDKLNELDKTKQYLVYCRSSSRSGNAMPIFKELGFSEVYDMAGGINEWKKAQSTI